VRIAVAVLRVVLPHPLRDLLALEMDSCLALAERIDVALSGERGLRFLPLALLPRNPLGPGARLARGNTLGQKLAKGSPRSPNFSSESDSFSMPTAGQNRL
jgi:hypothetical protein